MTKAFSNLKKNKAAGVDGLHSSFIKESRKGIVKPLVDILTIRWQLVITTRRLKECQCNCNFKKAQRRIQEITDQLALPVTFVRS